MGQDHILLRSVLADFMKQKCIFCFLPHTNSFNSFNIRKKKSSNMFRGFNAYGFLCKMFVESIKDANKLSLVL